ncbi:MAG: hypothetical protein IPP71_19290 [Bacteroidetes bacterium]|nr:hypothetical protein [Bacteroidota bacterium]
MKNILGLALIAGMFAFTSCGPSAEEKAMAEKAIQDSIAAADAQMQAVEDAARAQAEQDSWLLPLLQWILLLHLQKLSNSTRKLQN